MSDIQRNCAHHGFTAFVLRADRNYRCRHCAVDAVKKRRRKIKQMAVEYKGGACERCGFAGHLAALDFHHRDPNEKDFHLAKNGATRSWEKIKVELDKCELVCANCHRSIHADF